MLTILLLLLLLLLKGKAMKYPNICFYLIQECWACQSRMLARQKPHVNRIHHDDANTVSPDLKIQLQSCFKRANIVF